MPRGVDLRPPSSPDGIVEADDDVRLGGDEGGDEQKEQTSGHGAGRPLRPPQNPVVDGEIGVQLAARECAMPPCRCAGPAPAGAGRARARSPGQTGERVGKGRAGPVTGLAAARRKGPSQR
jgi:hypothetical protein